MNNNIVTLALVECDQSYGTKPQNNDHLHLLSLLPNLVISLVFLDLHDSGAFDYILGNMFSALFPSSTVSAIILANIRKA